MSLQIAILSSFGVPLKKTLKSDSGVGSARQKPIGFAKFSSSGLSNGIRRRGVLMCASTVDEKDSLYQPLEQVKKEEFVVPFSPLTSLARQSFSDECEAAINEQLIVEYNACHVFHAMEVYFNRDNIALKGLANLFNHRALIKRTHAKKLIDYQNKRGGRVKLNNIAAPPSEFIHVEKVDALYAMELALSLEKLVNKKLLCLHAVADRNNDQQLAGFIESEFLGEQVELIELISDYVSRLNRAGKGYGVVTF